MVGQFSAQFLRDGSRRCFGAGHAGGSWAGGVKPRPSHTRAWPVRWCLYGQKSGADTCPPRLHLMEQLFLYALEREQKVGVNRKVRLLSRAHPQSHDRVAGQTGNAY